MVGSARTGAGSSTRCDLHQSTAREKERTAPGEDKLRGNTRTRVGKEGDDVASKHMVAVEKEGVGR